MFKASQKSLLSSQHRGAVYKIELLLLDNYTQTRVLLYEGLPVSTATTPAAGYCDTSARVERRC